MTNRNEMGERMAKIETDINYIKDSINDIKIFVSKADERYACKQTEKEVEHIKITMAKYIGGATVLFVIVQIVLKMIFKV